jgi:hypothetical protein
MMTLFGWQLTLARHLSEDALTRLIFHELPAARKLLARRHLNYCSACRARFNELSRAAHSLDEHREYLMNRLAPPSPSRRDSFIEHLDKLLDSVPARPTPRRFEKQYEMLTTGTFAPSLKGALSMVCAGIILLLVWHWHLPSVSAAEFLNRAVASNRIPQKASSSEVIHRRFRIKTAQKTIEHDAYSDVTGRQFGYVTAHAEDEDLAIRLALAGVSWDDPLSAASFKNWHDVQSNPSDQVRASGDGLLTISTRLSSTDVTRETLTVREDSFHPVERTVEFRNAGAVDISEIGLDFLSSEAANKLFSTAAPAIKSASPRISTSALLPSLGQLNETELEARLILNQINADTGEQIEITRDTKAVLINALVESETRKKELKESLQALPYLSVTIWSLDDLAPPSGPAAQIPAAQQQSTVAQVSPFEQYFVKQGRSREDLSRISAGLFNSSLAIDRSSRSIEQLLGRFSSNADLSPSAIQARDELLSRVVERLLHDLKDQQQFLDEANLPPDSTPVSPVNSDAADSDLANLAELNTTLTRELISGSAESSRSETALAVEIAKTISQLRTAALSILPGPSGK